MAEQGTLCVNADVVEEAGVKANATYTAEAYTNKYIKKAEGKICAFSGYDWVTNYSKVSTIGKELLRDCCSAYAAMKCVKQDISGYTKQEALILINYLWAIYADTLKEIQKDSFKKHVLSADGTI